MLPGGAKDEHFSCFHSTCQWGLIKEKPFFTMASVFWIYKRKMKQTYFLEPWNKIFPAERTLFIPPSHQPSKLFLLQCWIFNDLYTLSKGALRHLKSLTLYVQKYYVVAKLAIPPKEQGPGSLLRGGEKLPYFRE